MRKVTLAALLLLANFAFAQKTILHCGKLIDVKNRQVLTEMSVIIEKDMIADVKKGYVTATVNDKVIDLKSKTVMPGLIDCHVHLESETNKNAFARQFTDNPADIAFESTLFAKITLLSGFTTVRDLGGSGVNIAMRKAIERGLIVGPRIYTAGKAIGSTGGHADPTVGWNDALMGNPGPDEGVADGVEECIKAVRKRYKDGSDLIKIMASGGVLSMEKDGSGAQYSEEEIKAIVQTAKDYGMKVAAHAHGAEAIKRAVRAGVASIEHGTYMDDEAMQLMKEYGTYYVPTIVAGKSVADSAQKPGYYPAVIAGKAKAIGPQLQKTFAKAYKAGVKIAYGTDAGVFAHGKNWKDFVYMTEAGMPVLEVLQAATLHAAELIGDDKIGIVEKDKAADIIAVDGDPLKDINAMGKVSFVMKAGVVYKGE